MNKTRLISAFLALLCFSVNTMAQYYSSGQDPFSVKWNQIRTDHFQIIFPKQFEAKAQYAANLMEMVYSRAGRTLDEHPGRIPLILHEYSSYSNAFVGWAPKRMEYYSVPPQDAYAQPWLQQLALHEYRHVAQISKMNQGTTRVLYWILGQQGTAAIVGLYIPFWLLEGDATVLETAMSRSGRGRTPVFENLMRAQILEKGLYTYDKAMFRSYRDFVPDQYVFGYHFVAQTRKTYGAGLWNHAMNVSARKAYMIVPFNHGIKQVTGKSKVNLYKETFNFLKSAWQNQLDLTQKTFYRPVSRRSKTYTEYTNPSYMSDSMVVAIRTGIDDITRYVSISGNGKEKIVFTPGSSNRNMLSFANGKLYWSESEPDPRWENRSYSVIREYDLQTGKRRKLSRKSRYFVPAISPDGKRIAAVEVDEKDQYALVILDPVKGSVINRIRTIDNSFFMTPRWSEDNRTVATILMNGKGKGIAMADSETGKISPVTPFSFTEISKPLPFGGKIYFTGAYNGIDNIYAVDSTSKTIYQLTSSAYGATDVSLSGNGGLLLYSDYTSDGYQLVEMPMDSALWLPLGQVEDHSVKLHEDISLQEGWVLDEAEIPDSAFDSGRFRRFPHLFNFHSWAPVSLDISSYEINPGLMLLSQNKLSTSFFAAGYRYNINEKTGKVYFNYSYQGFYPVIDLDVDYGKRKSQQKLTDGSTVNFEWMETNIGASIRVPLTLTRGKYYKGITPMIIFDHRLRNKLEPGQYTFRYNSLNTLGYRTYAYHQLRTSVRDIYPRWGQIFDINYYHTPSKNDQSNIFALNTYYYFPGIIKHHGLRIYAAYQQRLADPEGYYYSFSDLVNYPRGITEAYDERLLSLSATYKFPFWYPDWSLPPVLYLQRLKLALFYDYAIGQNTGFNDTYYRTAGADLSGDMHIFRFIAPFDLGVRAIYIFSTQRMEYQFLINVSFDSFYVGQENKLAGKIY